MFVGENGFEMQRVNEYRFYELGQKIAAIRGITNETTYRAVWVSLWEARQALQSLKNDVVAMRVSIPIVDRLIAAITLIVPEDASAAMELIGKDTSDKPRVVGWGYWELEESLKQFEPVLSAECSALDTYVVSQKRGYVTSDLVDHAAGCCP